VGSKLTLNG